MAWPCGNRHPARACNSVGCSGWVTGEVDLNGSGTPMALPAYAHDTVTYYLTDSLHSVVVELNAQRQVIARTYYAPYGQVLNRPLRNGPGYTGHEEDPATGLVYMQQRYYDPEARRFISTDPVAADPNTGGNFNRYEYANDNPYRYTDPDGRCTGSHITTNDGTGTCASTGGFTTDTNGAMQGMVMERARRHSTVGSSSSGLIGNASVPAHIASSGHNYSSVGGAAKAFGDAYYAQGVKEKSEYQTGIIYEHGGIYGTGGYDYVSPGAGPSGARMVDPTALFNAINAAGFNIVAWAHTHWDSNLMFSGADMQFVYRTHGMLFMTNRDDKTYMLNYRILNDAASGYQGAERILQYIDGAKNIQGQPVQ